MDNSNFDRHIRDHRICGVSALSGQEPNMSRAAQQDLIRFGNYEVMKEVKLTRMLDQVGCQGSKRL
jgi:hypothetical protein